METLKCPIFFFPQEELLQRNSPGEAAGWCFGWDWLATNTPSSLWQSSVAYCLRLSRLTGSSTINNNLRLNKRPIFVVFPQQWTRTVAIPLWLWYFDKFFTACQDWRAVPKCSLSSLITGDKKMKLISAKTIFFIHSLISRLNGWQK